MKNITCKLTGLVGPPVKAHIIPESFYLFSKNNRKPSRLISLDDSSKVTPSPKGIYDKTILIDQGERYFSDCDKYAYELLIKRGKDAKCYHDGRQVYVLELFEYNYNLLKLFVLSILWRSSISSQAFFSNVRLGHRHEDELRTRILENDVGGVDDYTTIFTFYEDVPGSGFGIISPWSERREKVRFYKFQLAYWIVFIKVDQQKCPEVMKSIALSPDSPFRALNQGRYSKSETFKENIMPTLQSLKSSTSNRQR